ncbi:MAG: methylmalonyl-CoA epimerase [Candidatus Bipolaricaulota bacterium]|nr:methylmalonyl-CoA epimerase [Candidatus Bipolaricaulota bacterium]MCS7274920.1 methylmalonyl-CoA epimerase [Candidatus Bipolaricaulota bacterium]MDW8110287.1 methylmalonyl-CoA epimerase [Candidatus Bipolaricaulota bacterium]MDW8329967.1 methylmalonyl-CoA epimerase [Candidatus Bipolaricaulota bacterium]
MQLVLDHIGIAVKEIDATLKALEGLGLAPSERGTVAQFSVEVCMLSVGNAKLELLQPLSTDSPIAKFLEKRGEGIHHIALRVANIAETLTRLKAQGVQLIDESPRTGFGGHLVAFIHPKSTHGVLIELVQHKS